jgi:flagellar basal-body rod protein FlgF
MSTGIWMAASGASSQITALDATANNLANANTAGYKVDQAVFQEHLISAMYSGRSAREMRYNGVATVAPDMRGGPLQITNKPLDVAVEGDGFFAIQTPRGERYTRAGAFQIGPEGNLVTAQGYAVLDQGGSPISVQPDAKVMSLGDDGVLTVDDSDVGQLKVVTFNQQNGLEKDGDTLFRATPLSGAAVANPVATVHAGALEMPNVSIVKGMTDLVSATRAFEALERAVEEFSKLEHRAATDIVGAR